MAQNSLLSPDQDQDEALNRGQSYYDEKFNDIVNAEKEAGSNDQSGGEDEQSPWEDNTSGGGSEGSGKNRRTTNVIINFAKKRGAFLGIGGALLVGGGMLSVLLGPAGMLFSLMENLSITGDSTSVAMERRLIKVFTNMTDPKNNDICSGSPKSIKCRMGRISNAALAKLDSKGVKPIFNGTGADGADGEEYKRNKKGYPDKNPSHYRFTLKNGDFRTVAAADLKSFLSEKGSDNVKFRSLILGRGGAFNPISMSRTGKVAANIFKKLGVSRDGGLADGKNSSKKSANERLKEARDKLNERTKKPDGVDKVTSNIKDRANKHVGKAKKGGAAYMTAVASCMATKVPTFISAGAAAYQVAQLAPIATDIIRGPGAKAKSSAISSGFTDGDMDTVGTLLTNKVDGKAPTDSNILMSAAGINNGRPAVPSIAPGFAILTNPTLITLRETASKVEEPCNAVLSPTAMYTAASANLAISAATAANPLIFAGKAVADLAISVVVGIVVEEAVGALAQEAIKAVIDEDAIPNVKGESLGDAIALSDMIQHSSFGLGNGLPVLSQGQIASSNAVKQDYLDSQKEMDIATLSPFDTSSRYTFMGSVFNNIRTAAFASGGYSSIIGGIQSIASMPFSLLSINASAANYSDNYCSYATDFGLKLDTSDNNKNPAINIAGLPCTGITQTQASMSTDEAINHMTNEGWLNTELTSAEDSTIQEMLGKDIPEDTPLYEFIDTCGNPETGDYLFTAAGCMIGSDSSDSSQSAMTPFIIDYNLSQGMNGEYEEGGEAESSGGQLVGDKAYPLIKDSVQSPTTYGGHNGVDFATPQDQPIFAVAEGVVIEAGDNCSSGGGCGSLGNHVFIQHNDGITVTRYLHMVDGSVKVNVGDTVKAGTQLGGVGTTGDSSGNHLHFDVLESGNKIGDDASLAWLKKYNILPTVNQDWG